MTAIFIILSRFVIELLISPWKTIWTSVTRMGHPWPPLGDLWPPMGHPWPLLCHLKFPMGHSQNFIGHPQCPMGRAGPSWGFPDHSWFISWGLRSNSRCVLGPHKSLFTTHTTLVRHPWPLMGLPWPLMGFTWSSISHIQPIVDRQPTIMVEIPCAIYFFLFVCHWDKILQSILSNEPFLSDKKRM